MTSAELIAQLQALDPEGTTDVCVGNEPVHFAQALPAYWDGRLQRIMRNDKGRPVSGSYVTGGNKLCIMPYGIEDAIFDDPDFPVDFTELERTMPESVDHYKQQVERMRRESREAESPKDNL